MSYNHAKYAEEITSQNEIWMNNERISLTSRYKTILDGLTGS